MQFARFCDVSEGNGKNTQNKVKMVIFGTFFSPWAIRRLRGEATSSPGVSHQLAWASWAASSSPYFSINRRGRLRGRGSAPLVSKFH